MRRMTREEALAELIRLNAEADARQAEIEAMVAFNDAISPLAHGRYAGIARS